MLWLFILQVCVQLSYHEDLQQWVRSILDKLPFFHLIMTPKKQVAHRAIRIVWTVVWETISTEPELGKAPHYSYMPSRVDLARLAVASATHYSALQNFFVLYQTI